MFLFLIQLFFRCFTSKEMNGETSEGMPVKGNGSDMSVKKIVRKCIDGDRESFRHLYDTYKDRVFSTCIRMLGNAQDAEDALQDIFVKVHKNISAFEGKSAFTTWLYRIAVNTCIEHLRKRKDNDSVDIDVTTDTSLFVSSTGPSDNFRLIVDKEIMKLPEGYRSVFILHAVEGFKHHEIAKILDISTGTSKSQYYQARERLRKNLLPYLEVLRYELQ